MTPDKVFYTATMAKVHAAQGNLQKATEIYRYLLEKEPDRQDLKDALSEIDNRRQERSMKNMEDLVPLIGEWIDLVFQYSRIQRLGVLKAGLTRKKPVVA